MHPSEDTWVGATAAGRRLLVNRSTVRRWAEAGYLRGERTAGGHWRFRLSEIEQARDRFTHRSAAS